MEMIVPHLVSFWWDGQAVSSMAPHTTHIYTHAYTHKDTHVCTCTHRYTHMPHTDTYMHMHTHMCVHTLLI